MGKYVTDKEGNNWVGFNSKPYCLYCAAPMPLQKSKKGEVFCSDSCRANLDMLAENAGGNDFDSLPFNKKTELLGRLPEELTTLQRFALKNPPHSRPNNTSYRPAYA